MDALLSLDLNLLLVVGTIFAGVIVGVSSAMFGIGGGVIMVPLLRLLYGLPAPMASSTSLTTTIPTTVAGLLSRRKDGEMHVAVGVVTGIAGALISPLGAQAATHLPGVIAMTLTAIIIIYTAYNMFMRARNASKAEAQLAAIEQGADLRPRDLGPQARKEAENAQLPKGSKRLDGKKIAIVIGIGILAGFISGFIGLSGVIIVPIYVNFLHYTMKEASATSLIAVAILSTPAVITHIALGNVQFIYVILLLLGSLPGSRFGSYLVRRISNIRLSYFFAAVLVISGLGLILRELVY